MIHEDITLFILVFLPLWLTKPLLQAALRKNGAATWRILVDVRRGILAAADALLALQATRNLGAIFMGWEMICGFYQQGLAQTLIVTFAGCGLVSVWMGSNATSEVILLEHRWRNTNRILDDERENEDQN